MTVARSAFESFRQHGEERSLLDAALLVAVMDRPEVDADAIRRELDEMVRDAAGYVAAAEDLEAAATGLCLYLREIRGLGGNLRDYHDPSNSFLDRVLATGRGIPISLAVIYCHLARGNGLVCEGVNFPGHFLVRLRGAAEPGAAQPTGETCLIDPFLLEPTTHAACEDLLQRMQGDSARLGPQHLRAATAGQVLLRMLTNLKQIALARGDLDGALVLSERMLWVEPDLLTERRDRAALYEHMGLNDAAARELELLAGSMRASPARERVRARIAELKRRADADRVVH